MITFTTTVVMPGETADLEVTVRGQWKEGRPAPVCSDPSSPMFADDGDPHELEIGSWHCNTGPKNSPDFEQATLEAAVIKKLEAGEFDRTKRCERCTLVRDDVDVTGQCAYCRRGGFTMGVG